MTINDSYLSDLSSLEYYPQHFRSVHETERGQAIWRFLVRPDNVLRMQTASYLGRVAVEPLEPGLLAAFGEDVKDDRVKQYVGHAVRRIMESSGYHQDKPNVRIPRGILFKTASRYRNAERAKLVISPQPLETA
jgi:hypothetical protein